MVKKLIIRSINIKDFTVTVDVVFSGDVYVSANTEEEAKKKIKEIFFVPSDLKNFHFLSPVEIVDIVEE